MVEKFVDQFNIMKSSAVLTNEDIIKKRIYITFSKIEKYIKNKDMEKEIIKRIKAYVRVSYILGEPCWGRNSSLKYWIRSFY